MPQSSAVQQNSSEKLRSPMQCHQIKTLTNVYNTQNCSQVSRDLYKICTFTDEGVWFLEQFTITVLTARTKIRAIHLFCGGAECSPACRGALLEVKAKLGCCINSIFSNSFVNLVYFGVCRRHSCN